MRDPPWKFKAINARDGVGIGPASASSGNRPESGGMKRPPNKAATRTSQAANQAANPAVDPSPNKALVKYGRKRSFSKTPEPEPAVPAQRHGPLLFIVQKHAARRLHYDFRL